MSRFDDGSEPKPLQKQKYAALDEAVQAAVKRRREEVLSTPEQELRWAKIQEKFQDSEVKKVHDFKEDLARGHSGEHQFFQKYQHCLVHLDGRNADFELIKSEESIELKTDYYDMNKTGNFFIETYSYSDKNGGVFQAADKKITYFIYYFVKNDRLFVFNTQQLVRKCAKLKSTLKTISIKNKGYETKGILVPIETLEHLCLNPEDIGLFEK
jgi:hypothetical protein